METLSEDVLKALAAKKLIKIDLGSGHSPRSGFFSVDKNPRLKSDICADLCKPLTSIPANSVSHAYSRHAFEHLPSLQCIMEELFRVVVGDGIVEIVVPHFSNVYAMSDPTHVRQFGIYSMYYYTPTRFQPARKVPDYYSDAQFRVLSIRIEFYKYTLMDKLLAKILERLVNSSFKTQEFYERRLATYFHAWQIHYVLRPVKPHAPFSS